MIKGVFRLLLLITSFFALGYGGYLVYEKQLFPITHVSFKIAGGEGLYISSLQGLNSKESGFSLLGSYGGDQWVELLHLIAENLNHDSEVSAQISIAAHQNTLSIQGVEKEVLESIDGLIILRANHQAILNETSWAYWENDNYIVFSDQEINPKGVKKTAVPYMGNADFFYEGHGGDIEAIKLTDKLKFSTFKQRELTLKGKAVNPIPLLLNCPASAQFIQFFGSTRLGSDMTILQNLDSVNQMLWVEHKMAFIRNDTFEVVIGQQNDEQRLKGLIEEAVLLVAKDSLLKPSIYFNNVEIMPFTVDWNWTSLCPSIGSDMHYFAEYNDFVFLANNLKAMYWMLSSIQLGKTFDEIDLRKKIPTRVNYLEIEQGVDGMTVSSKTWIGQNISVNFSAITNPDAQSSPHSLLSDFDNVNTVKWILADGDKKRLTIMMIHGKTIQAFSLNGADLWTVEMEAEITMTPVLVDVNNDGNNELVVAIGSRLFVYDISDQASLHSSIETKSPILKFYPIRSAHQSGFVLQTQNGIVIFDSKGNGSVENLLGNDKTGGIKQWHIQDEKGEPLLFIQSELDSVYLIEPFKFKGPIQGVAVGTDKAMAPFFMSGDKGLESKILNYEDGFIKMEYLNGLGVDSIPIITDFTVDAKHWVKNGSNWLLGLEGFDKIEFFNMHALSELKIIKPEPNLMYLPGNWTKKGIFVFLNKADQKLFFIDEYGNLLMKNPIEYNGLFTITNHLVVTKSQNRVHVYNLN